MATEQALLADILRGAKARLIRIGWAKGDGPTIHAKGPALRCCAATAIAMANNIEYAVLHETAKLFVRANPEIDPARGIADWNDAPERTLEDVLAAYDKAIAAAEAAS